MSAEKKPMPIRKPAVFFVTLMPLLRTSTGSRPSVWLTRFCTSTAARSGSRPTSKNTVMLLTPLLELDEVR